MKQNRLKLESITKRMVIALFAIGMFGFVACSDDDDDDDQSGSDCEVCEITILTETVTSEFCDNGDGTITIIVDGVEETENLEGATFDQFIAAYEALGATCD